jgi:hypothetical protein
MCVRAVDEEDVYNRVLVVLVTGWMRDGTFFGWCFKGIVDRGVMLIPMLVCLSLDQCSFATVRRMQEAQR